MNTKLLDELIRKLETNTIEDIDLCDNDITFQDMQRFCTALTLNTSVTSLSLSGCKIIDKDSTILLAETLRKKNKLKRFTFNNGYLSSNEVTILISSLQDNGVLEELDLSYNKVNSEGVKLIVAMRSFNKTLRKLNLAGCKLRFETLSPLFGKPLNLIELNLAENEIYTADIKHIAEHLKSNSCLKELNLASNAITQVGAKYLAEALNQNNTLTELKMWNNNIQAAGARCFINTLKSNRSLTQIFLQKNHLGASESKIQQELEHNLKRNGVYCQASDDYKKALQTADKQTAFGYCQKALEAIGEFAHDDYLQTLENQIDKLIAQRQLSSHKLSLP